MITIKENQHQYLISSFLSEMLDQSLSLTKLSCYPKLLYYFRGKSIRGIPLISQLIIKCLSMNDNYY